MSDRALARFAATMGAAALLVLPQAGLAHADTVVTTTASTPPISVSVKAPSPVTVSPATVSPVTVSTAAPGSVTVSGGNGINTTRKTTAVRTIKLPLDTTPGALGVPVPVIPKPSIVSVRTTEVTRNRNVQAKLPQTTVSIAPVKVGLNLPQVALPSLPSVPLPSLPKGSVTTSVDVTTAKRPSTSVSISPVKPVAVTGSATTTDYSPSSAGALADTGSEVRPWVVLGGAAMVLIGLDLVVAGSRRRYF